jgi:molybdopterin/thiamine biosynthesis adenylyltransferase
MPAAPERLARRDGGSVVIQGQEDYLDRLRIQPGWDLSPLSQVSLMLCGNNEDIARTLALAAASSGISDIVLVGDHRQRHALVSASEQAIRHLGFYRHIPVHSPGFTCGWGLPNSGRKRVWMIDAGDTRNDKVRPDEKAYFYAQCRGEEGQAFLAIGTDRDMVAQGRDGVPPVTRAEIPAVCSHLLIGIMADLAVHPDLEPLPSLCRIPLPSLPEPDSVPPSAVLYAGGGGAIAHQVIWAESLDPVLREANRRGSIVIVDPKEVHESCRSRQWGYGPEALHESKALRTAIWLESLFPGARVTFFDEPLSKAHFRNIPPAEAVSSLDSWAARRQLADIASEYELPWWSAGTSFLGGFARQVSAHNQYCASAYVGVERLGERPEDAPGSGTSCSGPSTPLPSSVLPHMIVGSWIACQRRASLLDQADPIALARGIEVHMDHGSRQRGYEGLRWSPGRYLNLKPRDDRRRW